MNNDPATGECCSLRDPDCRAAAGFRLPLVACTKGQQVAPQARILSYQETCTSPSPHPSLVLKPSRAAAPRTKEKAIAEWQGHTSAAFHTFLSLTSRAWRSFFSLKQLNNCKLYTNWLNLWPSALVIIWAVSPGRCFLARLGGGAEGTSWRATGHPTGVVWCHPRCYWTHRDVAPSCPGERHGQRHALLALED